MGIGLIRGLCGAVQSKGISTAHVRPNVPLTNADSGLPGFLRFPRWNGGASPLSMGAVLQPLAAGLQNTYDLYSSLAGSMVPLLHINIKCQAWNRDI